MTIHQPVNTDSSFSVAKATSPNGMPEGAPDRSSADVRGFQETERPAAQPAAASGMSRKSKFVSAVSAIALIAVVGGIMHASGEFGAAPVAATPAPMTVTASNPLKADVADFTEFTGQFSAVNQVELRAQVSGYLTEIHFTDGQIVRKGDLLFVIDPRPYEIQLQQAQAQLATAKATLDLANKQLGRTAQLHQDQFATGDFLDQREQSQKTAAAAVQQGNAAVAAAQLNLTFTKIIAPFDGRVSLRNVSIGSLVTGGVGSSSGSPLTNIVSLNPIHLDFDMSERDYLNYQRFSAQRNSSEVEKVQVKLSDEKGFPRIGQLDFIDNQVDRSSGTLHARATLLNPDRLIAPGQFARLRLQTGAAQSALLVPDAAVVADQSRKSLMVVDAEGVVTPRAIEVGALQSETLRVVSQGLQANDRVVIDGLMRARPGSKVKVNEGKISMPSKQ